MYMSHVIYASYIDVTSYIDRYLILMVASHLSHTRVPIPIYICIYYVQIPMYICIYYDGGVTSIPYSCSYPILVFLSHTRVPIAIDGGVTSIYDVTMRHHISIYDG